MSDQEVCDFLDSFKGDSYPAEFSAQYDVLECPSHNEISETLLVLDKTTGQKAICKIYPKGRFASLSTEQEILSQLEHAGLPRYLQSFEDASRLFVLREYINGQPLKLYAQENDLSDKDIIDIASQLSDILSYLHEQKPPIIHRDLKPDNIIIDQNKVWLIDFGIARHYSANNDSDTEIFGTRDYAPPEQYDFSQTDARADIYSLGVVLRFLLTGSAKKNSTKIKNKQLAHIIDKCTQLDSADRYQNAESLRRALTSALPTVRGRKRAMIILAALVLFTAVFFGWQYWQAHQQQGFDATADPQLFASAESMSAAAEYMNNAYNTKIFAASDERADFAYLKQILVEVYGLPADYVNAPPEADPPYPHEAVGNFFPWSLPDSDPLPRPVVAYSIGKIYWPEIIMDLSSLKDDNGMYPHVRVADAYSMENGLYEGVKKIDDLTLGELAILFANAEKFSQNN